MYTVLPALRPPSVIAVEERDGSRFHIHRTAAAAFLLDLTSNQLVDLARTLVVVGCVDVLVPEEGASGAGGELEDVHTLGGLL